MMRTCSRPGEAGPTLPYLTLPYPTLPYHTLPYPTLLYPTLPYPTLPWLTLLYPTLPYLSVPCPYPGKAVPRAQVAARCPGRA